MDITFHPSPQHHHLSPPPGSPPSTPVSPPPPSLPWGSFHCDRYKSGKRCDVCSHMREVDHIRSIYFQRNNRIHGYLAHDWTPEDKIRWFIYCIVDEPCQKQYVGSSQKIPSRWASHKHSCNRSEPCNSTGLSKHFTHGEGCPNDTGPQKDNLVFTLIDHYDTTREKLELANHISGPKCQCSECEKLLNLENRWILRLGTFYGDSALNTRDEIKSKTRANWTKT